ncbi:Bug family tripartite tricarboxylate transporter substrate binding protein [Natrarchaeobaculum sulfurireducens]|uniref:Putative exported protein n=1 Tax=Natrarchaeobaculum sulfurireducens TaxID=2044521 RepID=A0A346PP90_9EURY|nr:tripartite tricarboxylate transporter substrate-binding protein [Natrarchaeobaculum sulfurireducens]AXR81335.1 putative exported protein [Natrarchaeobaculum sulfurireducens]
MEEVNRRRFLKHATVATAGVSLAAGCLGDDEDDGAEAEAEDDFPTDNITIVIPFGEGGGTDDFARTVAGAADDHLDVSIQFENEPGAGGLNGTQDVVQAEPDGYTLVAFNPPSTPTSWLVQQPPYEIGDLEGVATVGRFPYIIYANTDYEIEDFGDLIDRYEDGEFSQIAGQGVGTMVDVVARTLRDDVGLPWEDYIAYDGGGEVTEAVMSDEVSVGIGTDSGALAGAEEGRLEPIACIPDGGSAVFPDLESIAEQGSAEEGDPIDTLAMLQPSYWAPPGTPSEHIDVIAEALEQATEDEGVQEWAEDTGNVVEYSGPDEASQLLADVLETVPDVVDLDEVREEAES